MIATLVLSHLLLALGAFGAGRRVRGRHKFNAGVAYGRYACEVEHGYPHDPFVASRPRRRFSIRSDRQPEPLVTRDLPRSHPVVYDF